MPSPSHDSRAALDDDLVQRRLPEIPAWTFEERRLRRRFQPKDFRASLAWINRVGMLAEELDHHPDFHLTSWNRVELVAWSHDVNGISERDFTLARKIDELARKDGLS